MALFPAGCFDGGTSTETGNPGLTIGFRDSAGVVSATGDVFFFAKDANPTFFTMPPDDGVSGGAWVNHEPSTNLIVESETTITFPLGALARVVNSRPSLLLLKTAGEEPKNTPDFNAIFLGRDGKGSMRSGLVCDSVKGRVLLSDHSAFDTLWMDIAPLRNYSGAIDTAGLSRAALLLFVPGTPFYTRVYGDSFHFRGVPEGKLALRLITSDGVVRAMEDSLGKPLKAPLEPGNILDTLKLPEPVPVLAPPNASPSGQYAFSDSVVVALSADLGAAIYYTLDGATPGLSAIPYARPITLKSSSTLKAIAFRKGSNRSPVSVNNYVLVPTMPMATPTGRTFSDSLVVKLTAENQASEIFFTLDGTRPGVSSRKYLEPIVLRETTDLRAVAIIPSLGESRILEERYVEVPPSAPKP